MHCSKLQIDVRQLCQPTAEDKKFYSYSGRFVLLLLFSTVLMACQPGQLISQGVEQLGRVAETTAVQSDSADLAADVTAPLTLAEAQPPVLLTIAEIGLSLEVVPMGWVVVEDEGQRTTEWIVPNDAIGWHANSAGSGGVGNLLLSGHQAQGEALFAPLALGDITVGQEIEIADANGDLFLYQIVEVSEPIPVLGATEEDNNLTRSYVQPSEAPILTMMTGWPDFTTTHRIFAVAEYVGRNVQR